MTTQITFHGLKPSPVLIAGIRRFADRLERFYPRIGGCRVLVEIPHRHQRRGKHFRVRVDLIVPGGELVVAREPAPAVDHADPRVAIRDAFRAARRELRDFVRRRDRWFRSRSGPSHGWVRTFFPERGFGFLTDAAGREIYFHHRALQGSFAALEPGAEVRFEEEPGLSGPQASTVIPVGRGGRHLPFRPEEVRHAHSKAV